MIGVDTNILLRALTGDDVAQAGWARALLDRAAASGTKVLVNHVVLCEFAWVLERTFRLPRARIAETIASLLQATMVEVPRRPLVEEALASYRSGPAGFADHLIGLGNRLDGCTTTYTFDRDATRLESFEPVPPA